MTSAQNQLIDQLLRQSVTYQIGSKDVDLCVPKVRKDPFKELLLTSAPVPSSAPPSPSPPVRHIVQENKTVRDDVLKFHQLALEYYKRKYPNEQLSSLSEQLPKVCYTLYGWQGH
jgi:hypothetical protein